MFSFCPVTKIERGTMFVFGGGGVGWFDFVERDRRRKWNIPSPGKTFVAFLLFVVLLARASLCIEKPSRFPKLLQIHIFSIYRLSRRSSLYSSHVHGHNSVFPASCPCRPVRLFQTSNSETVQSKVLYVWKNMWRLNCFFFFFIWIRIYRVAKKLISPK